MTRFDIPAAVRTLLSIAVARDILDASDVYIMAIEHGSDFRSLVEEVVETAYTQRHHNGAGNSAVCMAADVAHVELNERRDAGRAKLAEYHRGI